MERRLIKQGGGGYTIYLPKKWVERNSLDKGNSLNVDESGANLIISRAGTAKKTQTEIHLTGLTESSIRTLITNTYRLGYDRITVRFEDEKQFKILQEVVKTRLIGFDIIKKQEKECVVESITEPSYEQFDNILKKMFLNIDEFFEITKTRLGIEKSETEDFEEVAERIQKYDNFCRRAIMKRKLIEKNSELFWTFLTLIIHAQRELYYLNKSIDKKTKLSEKQQELLIAGYDIFQLLEKAYNEKNSSYLGKIHEMQKNLIYKEGYALLKDKKANNLITYHLMVCIRELYQANSPLTGIIL